MKKIYLTIIALMGILTMFSQPVIPNNWKEIREENLKKDLLSNEDFFNKAELVIEGKVVKTFDAYDAVGNHKCEDIYTLQTFLVQQVYKGDPKLMNDTLYIVRHGGSEIQWIDKDGRLVGRRFVIRTVTSDNGISIDETHSDILFFVKSDFPDNPVKNNYSEKPKYKFLQDKEKAILRVRGNKIYGLNNIIFNTRTELYNYMRQFNGYTIPELPAIEPQQEYKIPVIPVSDSTQNEMIKAKWGDDKKKSTE
ncbi:MAG: hypothetical protein LBU51_08130 [Bacteroidales bacterium]|jgi:hypothetical protein|nr:hypothetical protein [Bacteroidales bacterium]